MGKSTWTALQLKIAQELCELGECSDETFLAAVGHTRGGYLSKIRDERNAERVRTNRYEPGQRHCKSLPVPPHLAADAARRSSAPRSITALVCGDPPPGYSALDKRGQQ